MGFGVHEGFRLDGQSSRVEADGAEVDRCGCSGVCGEQVSEESGAPRDRLEAEAFARCGQTCSLGSACHARPSHPQRRFRQCVLAVLRDCINFEHAMLLSRVLRSSRDLHLEVLSSV
jgi:hypothetical protein